MRSQLELVLLALERSTIGVTIADAAGRILYLNPAEAAMHGYAPEELLGQPAGTLGVAGAGGEPPASPTCWRREGINRAKDGRTFPVRLLSDAVLDEDGRVQARVTLCEDITEVRRALEAVERREKVLAALAFAAERFLDTEGWEQEVPAVLASLSHAAGADELRLELPGGLGVEAISWSWRRAAGSLPLPPLAPDDPVLAGIYHGPASGLPPEVRRRLPAGGSLAVVPIEIDGAPRGALVFIAEDEEREWRPSELEALQATARMLGTALQRRQVQAELAQVERRKREFLATVSHELRTPLTSVLGAVELLRGGGLQAGGERARELLEVAERNGERLQRLIEDLLDLERLEAGELRFQRSPVALAVLVEEAVLGIQGFAALHGVRVRAATMMAARSLVTDRNRLAQVLYNLLSNAIKFSAPGDEVVLAARSLEGEVEFVVRDRGPGIAEEVKGRLFERFVQAEGAPGGRGGGSGLGLSICKRLVEGLGGSIAVESAPASGTAVTVRLPLGLGETRPLV